MAISKLFRLIRGTSALDRPFQPIDATQALNLSAGVSNSSVLRGRSVTLFVTPRAMVAGGRQLSY